MIDTVLAFAFAIGFPLVTAPIYARRRPALQAGDWSVKRREYAETILWLGSMGLAPLILWLATGRNLELLGLGFQASWQQGVALLVALSLSGLLVLQTWAVRRDPGYRAAARDGLGPVAEFLPRSRKEMRWFRGVSFAAGVGEELFYRGFLIWYLGSMMPLLAAAVLSSLLFGLAHVMHGVQSTVRATVMGAIFAALYLFSGALWACILLHTMVDLTSGETGLAVLSEKCGGDSEGD